MPSSISCCRKVCSFADSIPLKLFGILLKPNYFKKQRSSSSFLLTLLHFWVIFKILEWGQNMTELFCCPSLELFRCLPLLFSWLPYEKTVRLPGKMLQNTANVVCKRPLMAYFWKFTLLWINSITNEMIFVPFSFRK